MEILQIKDLTFKYPNAENTALSNINFSLQQGDFAVLCGESGCGKTTLLKLIKKELAPYGEQDGVILYNDLELSKLHKKTSASEIGYVMQNPETQIVTDKVWHELAFGLESLGCSNAVIRRRVAEMASYFGVEQWFHKSTAELSGGQKQLLNLASVMAMNPKLLLLDEPTAQLDPIVATSFISTLQKINSELGVTILIIEHRLEEVLPIADKVLLMDKGKLLYNGTPKGITEYFKADKNHPIMAGLPASMRIFDMLKHNGVCPITVKEGRSFIQENYSNRIDKLQQKPYIHSKEKAIELKDVYFAYNRKSPDILKGISLSIYKGEHFCILGGNGAGKTTALNIIAGLLVPYKGKLFIKGKNIKSYNSESLYRHNIALLPQNPQTAFIGYTLQEDFEEVCKVMNYKNKEANEHILKITDMLSITHLLNMHPYDLSGGEQQKAALAKILLLKPDILLLDEPTKGVDAYSKQALSKILAKLKESGITIVTVTHDIEFAAENADRCTMFFDGELTAVDTPTEFFAENSFYTTSASRISKGYYKNAILCSDVVALCKLNGKKEVNSNA